MAEWPPTYVAARAGQALEGMLARGFTTIRDVGGGDIGLARAVEEGYFTGPRIRYGGKQLTQTGGAGDWRAPSRRVYDDNYYSPAIGVICEHGVPQVRRAVREEVRRGARGAEVYLSGAVDSPSDRVDYHPVLAGGTAGDRGGGHGGQHLRHRACLYLAGHRPGARVRRALHRARQPDGKPQHPAVQEVWRILRAHDRDLPLPGPQVSRRQAPQGHRRQAGRT